MDIQHIKRCLADQREALENSVKEGKIIKREDAQRCRTHLASSLVKVITGPRRAGKSVLCHELLSRERFSYVNFDDERFANLRSEDLNTLLQAIHEIAPGSHYLFFDEIQNVPHWELFVNRLQRSRYNLVITGSNAYLLSRELTTHLTGRHYQFELFPFSFREYLDFHELQWKKKIFTTKEVAALKTLLNDYIRAGGFPEVVQGEHYSQYLNALYSSIITKDVALRHKVRSVTALKACANYLLNYFGCQISFNALGRALALPSVHTAQKYVSYLEEAYLIRLVERFSYKPKIRVSAPRKVYAIDTGLINAVSTRFSQDIGHLYENVVAVELLRKKAQGRFEDVYYWQDSEQREVDFVIKTGTRVSALIQVTYDIEDYRTRTREVDALTRASYALRCNTLFIITHDIEKDERIKRKRIRYIPLWKWLLIV